VCFPFAQLVPFFAYVEAFHFERVDALIQSCGLKPTIPGTFSLPGVASIEPTDDQALEEVSSDTLWLHLQNK
jgi:hypothetical protein